MNEVDLTAKLHPDFVLEGWLGMAAPRNVPGDVVSRMRSVLRGALADARVKQAMQKTGLKPVDNVCLNIEKFIQHDTERWRKRIMLAKITPR